MANAERIRILCSHLTPAETFADVGCDHGYMSEYMLKNGLCEKLYFSDVSKGSLEKAKKLLRGYDLKVKEIAHNCGFVDSNYFCRVFKRYTERSPSEYRRHCRSAQQG